MKEICEIRKMLECFALTNNKKRNYKKYRSFLENILKLKNEISKFNSNYSPSNIHNKFTILDRNIHLRIIKECSNNELIKIYHSILSFIKISQHLGKTRDKERLLNEIEELILFLEKLLNQDILSAKSILKKHLDQSENLCLQSLEHEYKL